MKKKLDFLQMRVAELEIELEKYTRKSFLTTGGKYIYYRDFALHLSDSTIVARWIHGFIISREKHFFRNKYTLKMNYIGTEGTEKTFWSKTRDYGSLVKMSVEIQKMIDEQLEYNKPKNDK